MRSYPEGTRTAVDAAAAVGCDVDQIVKSLVLMAGEQPVLVLCSGANRVDLAKVGAEFDPFGHPSPLPTLVDPHLLGFDEVWAAAGTPDSVFPLTPGDLVAATAAREADVAA